MKQSISIPSLKKFLLQSNQAGYAGGDSTNWSKQPDSSTTIVFKRGDWRSHDNFFGGEPYGGRLVIFHQDKPIWIMVYYGWIEPSFNRDNIYPVLQNALKQMPTEIPLRGPTKFKQNKYTYLNSWTGDITRYSGQEKIILNNAEKNRQKKPSGKNNNNQLAYRASYLGGLVDVN